MPMIYPEPAGRAAGTHILVIEDKVLIALDVGFVLKPVGVAVVDSLASAAAALEELRHQPVDGAQINICLGADTMPTTLQAVPIKP